MRQTTAIHIRIPTKQIAQLKKLEASMQLERSSVVRLAIARLAEEEALRIAYLTERQKLRD